MQRHRFHTNLVLLSFGCLFLVKFQLAQSQESHPLPFATFEMEELEQQRGGKTWHQFLESSALYSGIYVLKVGARDGQRPHEHDEVYYVLAGEAEIALGTEGISKPVKQGSVIFVRAHEQHRFHSISQDLHLLVFFSTAVSDEVEIGTPIMFNTPDADAILSTMKIFPDDNPINQPVSEWPVHPRSTKIVASIGLDKPLRYNSDMGYILVPPKQKKVPVRITGYPEESDKGPYPVPENLPIEGWPAGLLDKSTTLHALQRNGTGDRHAIVVDPKGGMLYEFYQTRKTARGWQATCQATFDLKTNRLRPDGWTSADAAGLPIFPFVVRYDELERGEIKHALRLTVRQTRRAYVHPARHFASRHNDSDLPRMGERLRLRQDFDTSGFSRNAQTILNALKTYGMLVADNGIEWAVSVTPDQRIGAMHDELRRVHGSDFEVVVQPGTE